MAKSKKKFRPIRVPKRTEASIEATAVAKIEAAWPGVLVRKLNGAGNRNWPDRLVVIDGGRSVYLEFKRPGEVPHPGQEWLISQLRSLGQKVYVVKSSQEALDAISEVIKEG